MGKKFILLRIPLIECTYFILPLQVPKLHLTNIKLAPIISTLKCVILREVAHVCFSLERISIVDA